MSSGVENPMILIKEDDRDDGGQPFYIHRKNSYDLNSKIMLTAIISLSAVVLLVLALHIYARYVIRRQARRRRTAIQRLVFSVDSRSAADQPPRTGLDPSVIASLPIFAFKLTNERLDSTSSSVDCAVCLSALDDGEFAKLLPNCKHTFHVECIDKWLSSRSTCPICRTEVEPRRLEPEPREGPVESSTTLPASAPPFERSNSVRSSCIMEGTSSGNSGKVVVNNGNNSSRLSSFRRIITRERSSSRIQPCDQQQDQDVIEDLERQ